jgi:hypothetical protein
VRRPYARAGAGEIAETPNQIGASFARSGKYESVIRTGDRELLTVEDDAIACPQRRTWNNLEDATSQPVAEQHGGAASGGGAVDRDGTPEGE